LDEEEAFHRCSGFEFRGHSITTIIIRKINYLIFHNYQQIGVFRGLGDAEYAEARMGGDAEERRGDVGGVICVFALLEKGFWCLRGRVTGRKMGGRKMEEGWGGLGGMGFGGGGGASRGAVTGALLETLFDGTWLYVGHAAGWGFGAIRGSERGSWGASKMLAPPY
jgi:hypothetical protein